MRNACEASPYRSRVRSISGLVAEYIVAIDVTRVRFPADALRERGPLNTINDAALLGFESSFSWRSTRSQTERCPSKRASIT